MKTLLNICLIIIAVLTFIIATEQCRRKPCPEPITEPITIIIPGDSIPKPAPPVIASTKDSIQVIYDTITREVDSAAIIRDYLATVTYKGLVLRDDSLLYASIDLYLSRNRYDSIIPSFAIRKPTTVITTNYIYPTKDKVISQDIGFFHINSASFTSSGLQTSIKYRKWSFRYGYGTGETHLFQVGYQVWTY